MKTTAKKTFLITGVGGYWGAALLRCFSETKFTGRILGVDIKKPARDYPFLEFHRMDVRDPGLDGLLARNRVHTVLHLAFALNVFAPDSRIRDVNIRGTRNVLECAVKSGARKFILASSSAVYGAFPENMAPFNEDASVRATPELFYTRDKVEIEKIVREFRAGRRRIRFVVLRPSIITGPSMGNILSSLLRILYFIPAPAGRNSPLQFIHEDDLARATRLVMTRECEGVYNLTGDGGVPFNDLLRLCGKAPLPLPRGVLLSCARSISRLGAAAPFAGAVDLLSYPWLISNKKFKRDFAFTFRHDSRAAFDAFAAGIGRT